MFPLFDAVVLFPPVCIYKLSILVSVYDATLRKQSRLAAPLGGAAPLGPTTFSQSLICVQK